MALIPLLQFPEYPSTRRGKREEEERRRMEGLYRLKCRQLNSLLLALAVHVNHSFLRRSHTERLESFRIRVDTQNINPIYATHVTAELPTQVAITQLTAYSPTSRDIPPSRQELP
ncbi:hypothetical protein TWF225_007349 [Orbilia oligospora]|nr:hypothetical protein TWF225_007349 [Orbilia oligospora]KAF3249007.1 hypothetical protein TWF217_008985 [Orbilia oligospora]KAF3262106.1 hypothetical protein TWF128_002783 [Orbilia oligospora]KAF3290650.1 hypothetical protein TWF132_006736 [Orbilia oligospora]